MKKQKKEKGMRICLRIPRRQGQGSRKTCLPFTDCELQILKFLSETRPILVSCPDHDYPTELVESIEIKPPPEVLPEPDRRTTWHLPLNRAQCLINGRGQDYYIRHGYSIAGFLWGHIKYPLQIGNVIVRKVLYEKEGW